MFHLLLHENLLSELLKGCTRLDASFSTGFDINYRSKLGSKVLGFLLRYLAGFFQIYFITNQTPWNILSTWSFP